MQVILVLLSLVVSALGQTSQTCQVCHSSNGVYCFNQTYYQYCMKNTLMGDVLKCVTGQYCSAENGVCTSDATKSSCDSSGGSEASCTQCTRDKTFACLSKTEFARCTSGGSPAFTASCEAGDICVESSYETYGTLCVPPCVANFVGTSI
ncbi:hypothetical protein KR018_008464 [Drosophila ironensis]|nr:hypothetical protein KR018_008464 [Drosophila ironensis]